MEKSNAVVGGIAAAIVGAAILGVITRPQPTTAPAPTEASVAAPMSAGAKASLPAAEDPRSTPEGQARWQALPPAVRRARVLKCRDASPAERATCLLPEAP